MSRQCDYCAAAYETVRLSSRFCSGTCRTRAHRDPAGVRRYAPHVTGRPVESAARESVQARYGVPGRPPGAPAAAARLDGPTCAAIRAELVATRRDSTFLGALAIDLADILDNSTGTLGVAALVKELRTTLDKALAGATRVADPLDALRERRERKMRGQ